MKAPLNTSLDVKLYARLNDYCEKNEVSRTDAVHQAIKELLDRNE